MKILVVGWKIPERGYEVGKQSEVGTAWESPGKKTHVVGFCDFG